MIKIGNAPCSWGVEFADDPRNPNWRKVLQENADAGYTGIELGPVGFMPEDPTILSDALEEFGQELVGAVVFRPFHDPDAWAQLAYAGYLGGVQLVAMQPSPITQDNMPALVALLQDRMVPAP